MGGRVAQRKYSRSSGSCDWGRQNGGGRMLGPERGDVISVAFLTACLPGAWLNTLSLGLEKEMDD